MHSETEKMKRICTILLKTENWKNIIQKPNITTITKVLNFLSLKTKSPCLSYTLFTKLPSSDQSLHATWTILKILTSHKHYRTAQTLVRKLACSQTMLPSRSVLRSLLNGNADDVDTHIFSWLVIRYAELRLTGDALQVFDEMRVWRMKPHLHACVALVSCLVKDGSCDTVWKVYRKMVELGVEGNLYLYNALLNACCRSRDVEKAEGLIGEMEMKGLRPDIFTFNTLVSLYCRRSMHYEALGVQVRMEKAGVSPDVVTYNVLIYGFCREGRMREAVRLFREIKGVTPNRVTYTTLIDGYCRADDLDEALRLRDVMEAKGLYPGVVTYNSILRKLCEEGRIREANRLLGEMVERKIEPDNVTCNTLVNAYCKIGDMRSALRVKNQMVESGLKLDQFTYKALIHGFCKVHEMDDAKEFLLKMIDAGFCPNYCTYSWIVDGYCSQGNEDVIVGLPDELTSRVSCADVAVYRALIRRLCKLEKLGSAEKLFTIMQGKGIPGDNVIYTSLAYLLMKSGKTTDVSRLLDEMYKRRLMVTMKTYRCFSASYAADGKILSLFWSHMVDRCLMSKSVLKSSSIMQQEKMDQHTV